MVIVTLLVICTDALKFYSVGKRGEGILKKYLRWSAIQNRIEKVKKVISQFKIMRE